MILADRGFANGELIAWLQNSNWHYCLRLPCDVNLHGSRRHSIEFTYLWLKKGEVTFYKNVGLWLEGKDPTNIVLASVRGAAF